MINDELVLKVVNVKKQYRLGVIGGGTLQGDLQSWWARIRGKDDPNSKIGQEKSGKNGTFMALRGVTFEVKKGERLGIIGGNGAGKSTTLKILSRVTAPTDGTIYIKGRISSMLEVGTGFHPELTGRENIYLNGAILGMSKSEVDRKIEDIIEFSECRQFIDTPVKRYSSGMYVKLAFSVAAHLDSEILIMDEVLAVGDMKFQQKCLNKMREVADNEGRTVLYVSHNMNTIRQLCERCIVLEKGKVLYDGNVEEAIQLYMGNSKDSLQCFYDIEFLSRPENSLNLICMQKLEFLNKRECVYFNTEEIRFKIAWRSYDDFNNIRFRAIIRYYDETPVGLVVSPKLSDIEKNQLYITEFGFNLNLLSEGKYFLSLCFYQEDQVGNSVILDHLSKVCMIEVYNSPEETNKLIWEHRWWGSVKFPELNLYCFERRFVDEYNKIKRNPKD
ncbi:polysaccharide ABC transporter ATP-binding protein [uncultured Thomasclavelia sp.]|uniref:ABC transporter ATP-binding protein n=1 Tax=uncultured Thomasclavelia sp. TaxID=3025759 RepID=UPI00280B895D|nr:polysaccharide ABC transporter ATP-binding protein [uncultured Thomasclavelia sp.]